jgi:uncharacterized membrane protein
MKKLFSVLIIVLVFVLPGTSFAQEVHQDFQELVRGEVLEILDESEREITGTDTIVLVQTLRVRLLDGSQAGEVVRFENDLIELQEGDTIFVSYLRAIDGSEYYTFRDLDRRPALYALGLLFCLAVFWLSGFTRGFRSLLSLALSFAAIIFLLIPALLKGYSPALVSLVIAGFILSVSLFLTHGFKPRVVITFFGTFGAVFITCLVSWVSVIWMRFTGIADDTSVYLNFATDGTLDLGGILLGGIIIGLLGVLDDVSITQASVVEELKSANPAFGFRELYSRALNVGRDHVGSLVNTLALAYAGTSLPLLLYYSFSTAPFMVTANQEVIAAEIVRILVGSIGLILAVPITTALAAWYFRNREVEDSGEHGHASHGHHHHHGHRH